MTCEETQLLSCTGNTTRTPSLRCRHLYRFLCLEIIQHTMHCADAVQTLVRVNSSCLFPPSFSMSLSSFTLPLLSHSVLVCPAHGSEV